MYFFMEEEDEPLRMILSESDKSYFSEEDFQELVLVCQEKGLSEKDINYFVNFITTKSLSKSELVGLIKSSESDPMIPLDESLMRVFKVLAVNINKSKKKSKTDYVQFYSLLERYFNEQGLMYMEIQLAIDLLRGSQVNSRNDYLEFVKDIRSLGLVPNMERAFLEIEKKLSEGDDSISEIQPNALESPKIQNNFSPKSETFSESTPLLLYPESDSYHKLATLFLKEKGFTDLEIKSCISYLVKYNTNKSSQISQILKKEKNLPARTKDALQLLKIKGKNLVYKSSTHILFIFISYLFCALTAGPLSSYSTLEPFLIRDGFFSTVCVTNTTGCDEQKLRLSIVYNEAYAVSSALYPIVGLLFDRFGCRFAGVTGAACVTVSMVILFLSTLSPNWNWLIYIGLPLADAAGFLNTISLFGFLWHYPEYKAHIVGIVISCHQMSTVLGHVLVWVLNAVPNISLGLSFLFGGALAAISAVVLRNILPTSSEYFVWLKIDTGKEWLEKKSLTKIFYRTLIVYMRYPKDNTLFGLFVVFVYVVFFQSFNYLSFEDPTHSILLTISYAYPVIAFLVSPWLGILLQRIGYLKMFSISIVNLAIFIILETLPFNYTRIMGQILAIFEISLLLTTNIMWVLAYASPLVLGTCFGMFCGMSGLVQGIINLGLPFIIEPLVDHIRDSYFISFLLAGSLALSCNIALTLWVWQKGLPTDRDTMKY